MKDAHDLITERFGVKTRAVENPLLTKVDDAALQILANNPSRLAWVIVNLSVNTLHIAFSKDVSDKKGIRLDPGGGSAAMVFEEDFHPVTWAIWGVGSAVDTWIYSYEVVIQ